MRHWLAAASIAVLGTVTAVAADELPTDPATVVPLSVGASMPAVVVRNADGTDRPLGPGPLARPTILIFYRGGWCPYCNRHLGALKKVEPELLALGYELLFLSADRPEILHSSLTEPDIHYTLLSDAAMNAARAYHIAYRVDDASLAKAKAYGVDLEAASGQTHHELPVPAVFILDTSGVIRFVYANPDYTTRIAPDALVTAARSIVGPTSAPTMPSHPAGVAQVGPQ